MRKDEFIIYINNFMYKCYENKYILFYKSTKYN